MKIVHPAGKDSSRGDNFKAYRTCICSSFNMDGHEAALYTGGSGSTCNTCYANCSDDSGPNTNNQANHNLSAQRNYA